MSNHSLPGFVCSNDLQAPGGAALLKRHGMTWARALCLGIVALAALAAAPASPAADVPEDAITLKVGQVLYVTFTANGDNLGSPHTQSEPSTTDPMVTLQLTQEGSTRTLLITNGFAKSLTYRALARMRGRRRTFEPPVIPVRAGMQSIVTLGEPFDEMLLYDFKLASG